MAKYKIVFPRWEEDVVPRKRTLVHLPCTPDVPNPQVGDSIIAVSGSILARSDGWHAMKGVLLEIVEAITVPLIESLTPLPGVQPPRRSTT